MIVRRIRWRFAVVTTHPVTGASQDVWKGRHSKPAWERFYAFCGLGYGTSVALVKRRTAQDGTAIQVPLASMETTHSPPPPPYEPPHPQDYSAERVCGAPTCSDSLADRHPAVLYCSKACAQAAYRERVRCRQHAAGVA